MKQELTKEQIDQLYSFCEKHYVRFYDVQMELVDHLANAIEEKLSENPHLSFNDALNSVYAGFGVMGFSRIITEKAQFVVRKWRKMRWNYFCSFFTWPKAMITITLIIVAFIIRGYINPVGQKIFLTALPLAFLVKEIIVALYFYRRHKKAKGKLLLTSNARFFPALSLTYFNMVFNLYGYLFSLDYRHLDNMIWLENDKPLTQPIFFLSALTLIILYLVSLAYQSTTEKILSEAERKYPEAFA